jgi:hypothetical protein
MKKLIIFLFSLPVFLSAQKVENFPYTRYGLGDLYQPALVGYRSMGYSTIANIDRFHVNFSNPASYAFLGTTAFEVGANAKNTTLTEGSNTSTNWGGTLDYFALGFPLKNPINEVYESKRSPYKLGMAFSLGRFSRTSYSIGGIDSLAEVGVFGRNYSGQGGTYKFQWGNAIQYKSFSFGVNLGYLFGSIKSSRQLIFDDLLNPFNTYIDRVYHIKAFTLSTGLIYTKKLNQKQAEENASIPLKSIRIGLTFSPATSFSTNKDELAINRQVIGTGSIIPDTLNNTPNLAGKGKIGGEIGLGIMFQNGEKSAYTAEVKTSTWSSYFNDATGEKANTLNNGFHASVGGYFRPDYKSYTSFWKRSFIKYGAYYDKDPRQIIDKELTSYGVTLGTGLPFVFQRKVAHADIGIDLGRRGMGTVIEEKYFKINFGFTFNDDEWFIKRKYN